MKIKVIKNNSKPRVVPPLMLQVTFETEDEMRNFRRIIGPLPASGPTHCFFAPLGEHLEKFSPKGA